MKIVVDVFGGDHSPQAQIAGGMTFLREQSETDLVFTGDAAQIDAELRKYTYDAGRVTVVHAPEVISNEESPTAAIRAKKESSLVKALELLKTREDICGLVSAGSTGAVLTGGIFKVGRLKAWGVLRLLRFCRQRQAAMCVLSTAARMWIAVRNF